MVATRGDGAAPPLVTVGDSVKAEISTKPL